MKNPELNNISYPALFMMYPEKNGTLSIKNPWSLIISSMLHSP